MNERIKELVVQSGAEFYADTILVNGKDADDLMKKFAELIVRECINCCDEVANEADAMKDSKFVTDAGRMLYEGMWGGATNSAVTIKNRFGVK